MTTHLDASALALFQEELLEPEEASAVRTHLAGCARCRQTQAQLSLVTELLAAAPAQPMPASLAARVESALAAEAAARSDSAEPAASLPPAGVAGGGAPLAAVPGAAGTPAEQAPALPDGAVADPGRSPADPASSPAARRGAGPGPRGGRPPRGPGRPRARLRALAVAAAILVVGGGGYAAAQLATRSGETSAAGSASAPAAAPAPGSAVKGPNHAISGVVAFSPVASGTDYTAHQFASQVAAVLGRYPAGIAARRPAVGERITPASGLAGCVESVTGGHRARLVDVARYQGRPAVIIVVSGGTSAAARAWAVGRDCSAARPDVLAHVTVPPAG